MKMAGTERAKLRRYVQADREARRTGVPVEEVFGPQEEAYQRDIQRSLSASFAREAERERARDRIESSVSRRDFLKRSGLVGAGVVGLTMLSASDPLARGANAATAPRVVVVGGGFAGLTAAYRIYKLKGWVPQVYEASERVSGRVETIRGKMLDGQYFEECASAIDSNQTGTGSITELCKELGLQPFVDLWLNYIDGDTYYHYLGKKRTWKELSKGVSAIDSFASDLWKKIRFLPAYNKTNATATKWDNKTVADLINSTSYPVTTPAGAYYAQTFGADAGGPASGASAIHAILNQGGTAIWPSGDKKFDERWAIPGGNDVLASSLVSRLPAGSVHLDQALLAMRKNTDNTYTLTFQSSGGAITTVVADRVVMANPPTTMKYIDYSAAGFSALKLKCFSQPLGNNAKLALQFNGQAWAPASGDAYSDMVTGDTWPVQFSSTKTPHLLLENNKDYPPLPPLEQGAPDPVVTETLAALDKLFPGISTKFIPGQCYISQHTQEKYIGGSYSYYQPGGFTGYQGYQKVREGNVHFAGEHTADYARIGYMDGAVRSGERVATEVTSC